MKELDELIEDCQRMKVVLDGMEVRCLQTKAKIEKLLQYYRKSLPKDASCVRHAEDGVQKYYD